MKLNKKKCLTNLRKEYIITKQEAELIFNSITEGKSK